jgi:hypothetical protein
MSTKPVSTFNSEQQQLTRVFVAVAIILIGIGIGLFWTKVYESPKNVFWGMISGSLGTPGVSLQVVQSEGTTTLNESLTIGFGATKLAHGVTTLSQGSTVVKTETIGLPTTDYTRYLAVSTTTPAAKARAALHNVLGVWAKSPALPKGQSLDTLDYLYGQSTLGVVPFANISDSTRHHLVSQAQTTGVYSVNWSQVKHEKVDGHANAYVYSVSVAPRAYVSFMQAVSKAAGLGSPSQFNPKNYSARSVPIKVVFSVDPMTRALITIAFGESRTETVTNYGVQPQVSIPQKTISTTQLEERLVAAR